MGNSSTKEQRTPQPPATPSQTRRLHQHEPSSSAQPSTGEQRVNLPVYASRPGRGSRPDLSFLGIGASTVHVDPPEVRRETKQEREARKLAKERELREKERERSMKEEHIDGGFCVTQGVYVGTEDFNKAVVRQLMIERRMAPFWRGLETFRDEWTEHQLVAAARGLPIPAADDIPPEDPNRPSPESPRSSTPNLQNLMVPISSRSHSQSSDMNISPSHPAFSLPSPTSPISTPVPQSSSPFRPRSKTLASLTSKNPPQSDMVPREIQLPKDQYVKGQMMEAFLYKDSEECPICFIYYPPFLNKTRCCDQPICSECFVQIKRPDPHPPEHADPSNPAPPPIEAGVDPEALVSEPANCPYCQQAEFGVTYEPPPFRRGLAYANSGHGHGFGSVSSAMSSSSSLNSVGSPSLIPTSAHRRRTTSISANASTVITTDRIRSDWATKLANARNHAARRSAAATALHTAAYLMGNGVVPESRSFAFSRTHRFGRRGTDSPGSGAVTPQSPSSTSNVPLTSLSELADRHEARRAAAGLAPREGGIPHRRSRMDDLEDMMMLEAIRLSLAAEEERKRREDKDAEKDAKKKKKAEEKANKKAEKAAKRGMYSGGNSSASASGSALSLALPGTGRRRGNSGSSAFLREATTNSADKGKSVDRTLQPSSAESSTPPPTAPLTIVPGRGALSTVFGHHNDASPLGPLIDTAAPSPTATAPEKPSHLRQMSNASSPASSFIESVPGSLRNGNGFHGSSSTIDSPNASGTYLSGTPDREGDSGSAGTEPMFNFRSLTEMMSREDEKNGTDNRPIVEHSEGTTYLIENGRQRGESSASVATTMRSDIDGEMAESVATLKVDSPEPRGENPYPILGHRNGNAIENGFGGKLGLPTPEVMITPETPAAATSKEEQSKQLGAGMEFTARQEAR